MKSQRKLTDTEMLDITNRVARSSYKFIRRRIQDELERYYPASSYPDMNDIVHVTLMALTSIDSNILIMMRNIFRDATGTEIELDKIMKVYFDDLIVAMNDDEDARKKNKMN